MWCHGVHHPHDTYSIVYTHTHAHTLSLFLSLICFPLRNLSISILSPCLRPAPPHTHLYTHTCLYVYMCTRIHILSLSFILCFSLFPILPLSLSLPCAVALLGATGNEDEAFRFLSRARELLSNKEYAIDERPLFRLLLHNNLSVYYQRKKKGNAALKVLDSTPSLHGLCLVAALSEHFFFFSFLAPELGPCAQVVEKTATRTWRVRVDNSTSLSHDCNQQVCPSFQKKIPSSVALTYTLKGECFLPWFCFSYRTHACVCVYSCVCMYVFVCTNV